jgi:hypothetical protein
MTFVGHTIDLLLPLLHQMMAVPVATLVASTPGNLLMLALIFGPLGALASLWHGNTPKAVGARAIHWIGSITTAGVILVLVGVPMEPWNGVEGWANGALRGATFGAFAAGLRLAFAEP